MSVLGTQEKNTRVLQLLLSLHFQSMESRLRHAHMHPITDIIHKFFINFGLNSKNTFLMGGTRKLSVYITATDYSILLPTVLKRWQAMTILSTIWTATEYQTVQWIVPPEACGKFASDIHHSAAYLGNHLIKSYYVTIEIKKIDWLR